MFDAKNKTDLIVEVWEKLDCESIGREEIVAIETVVRDVYGARAVDSPMVIARFLADEGAELRHSELMELYVERVSDRPHEASLNNLFDLTSLDTLLTSLTNAENLRRVLMEKNDNSGLRELRILTIETKKNANAKAGDARVEDGVRERFAESAEWITLWLQSPELFENWVKLRRASTEFRAKFIEN
ncbi:MAG: hypothetical protein ACRD6X_04680 [Pyrinomonadaceae bacterium]